MKKNTYDERRDFSLIKEKDKLKFHVPHLGGGIISEEDIDQLNEFPTIQKLMISGLTDSTLEYLISNHGNKFKSIYLFKCPKLSELKPLSQLTQVEEIEFYWNQKATDLWDMGKNEKLSKLSLKDFKKPIDLTQIQSAKALKFLSIGSMVPHGKTIIKSLDPLSNLDGLEELILGADKILDNNFTVFSTLKNLRKLHVPSSMYKLEVFAWLKVHLNKEASENLKVPIEKLRKPYDFGDKIIDMYGIGKGKRKFLNSEIDKKIIDKIKKEYETYYTKFKENALLNPE